MCDQAQHGVLNCGHIPESTAHVLVHYLYTGAFQEIRVEKSQTYAHPRSRLQSVLGVYAIAHAYDLPALEAAAKSRVERLGQVLLAEDRLAAAREAHPDPAEDETWFLEYLNNCLRALPNDPLHHDCLGFSGNVSTFSKTVSKLAIEISQERTTKYGPVNTTFYSGRGKAEGSELTPGPDGWDVPQHEPVVTAGFFKGSIAVRSKSSQFLEADELEVEDDGTETGADSSVAILSTPDEIREDHTEWDEYSGLTTYPSPFNTESPLFAEEAGDEASFYRFHGIG